MALYSTQDIVDAYNREVVGGGMSEADFVSRAMSPEFGVSAEQLGAARDVLLGGGAPAATTFDSGISAADRAAAESATFGGGTAPLSTAATTTTGALSTVPDTTTSAAATGALSKAATETSVTGAPLNILGQVNTNPLSGFAQMTSRGDEFDATGWTGAATNINGSQVSAKGDAEGNLMGFEGFRYVTIDGKNGYATDAYDTKGNLLGTTVDLNIGQKGTHLVTQYDPTGKVIGQSSYKEQSYTDWVIQAALGTLVPAFGGFGGLTGGLTTSATTNLASTLVDAGLSNTVANAAANSIVNAGVNAAIQLASTGKVDLGTVATGALGSTLTSTLGGELQTGNAVVDRMINGSINGAITAILNGTDPLAGAAKGATNAATSTVTSLSGLTSLTGGAGTTATGGSDFGTDLGVSTYQNAINAGMSPEEALAAANAVTGKVTTAPVTTSTVTGTELPKVITADTLTGGGGNDRVNTQVIDSEYGDLKGAITAATGRTTTNISNNEADSPQEAAALARARGYTSFTYGGQTYSSSATNEQIANQLNLNDIANAKTFNDAYALARQTLGPGQTFTWGGKQYSTATFTERSDLSGTSTVPGTTSTTAGAGRGTYAGYDSAADAAAKTKLSTDKATELLTYIGSVNPPTYDQQGNLISGGVTAPDLNTTTGKLANGVANVMNTFFGIVANNPVAAVQAGGNLLSNTGGIVDLVAGKSTELGDKLRDLGTKVDTFASSISDPQVKAQQQEISKAIDNADGFWNKTGALVKSVVNNPLGAANWVFTEAFEEVPGVGLALKAGSTIGRYGIAIANDMVESGGSAYNDTYKAAKQQGMSEEDARTAARNSSLASMVATGLTQGLVEGKLIGKVAGKETVGEGLEGGLQQAAQQVALGQNLDANAIYKSMLIEAAVGKGAQTSAEAVTATNAAVDNVTSQIQQAAGSGNAATVITNTIQNNLGQNVNPVSVVTSAVDTSLKSGVSLDDTVSAATLSSLQSTGMNAGQVAETVLDAVAKAGGDVNAASTIVQNTLVNYGLDTNAAQNIVSQVTSNVLSNAGSSVITGSTTKGDTTVVNSVNSNTGNTTQTTTKGDTKTSVTTDANTGATTNTSTNANTGVTTSTTTNTNTGVTTDTKVDSNTGVTTQTTVDANTNTKTDTNVNTNTGVNTQTTVNTNTGVTTNTTVDTNTNVTTETKTDPNTDTTTTTRSDPTDGTVTTTVTTSDGTVISETKDTLPPDYTPPVITVTDTTGKTPTTPTTPKTPITPKKPVVPKTPTVSGGPSISPIMAGVPMTFLEPTMLKSFETQKRLDPLAEVKQIQQEMEQQAMMQQLDPRLAAILQQRMGVQQPAPEAANEPNAYYSYGSEQPIDDILGAKAVNYAQGGYVAPLMATGGMTLPLMSKTGGALSQYGGREDFKGGKHVAGEGDGQSDDIPAWLADGEFVFPADVVSALGNGSTKAGTDKLYEMMHGIRERARSKGPKDLPPPALKSPLDYLKSSKRSAK